MSAPDLDPLKVLLERTSLKNKTADKKACSRELNLFCIPLLSSADFFLNLIFFQEYHQSVRQIRSRSGPTFCQT